MVSSICARNLLDAAVDGRFVAGAADDRRGVLVDHDRLARPSCCSSTFSSLMPSSSAMTCPPVRIAMSCSIALRRSPKPGALTARTLRTPRTC